MRVKVSRLLGRDDAVAPPVRDVLAADAQHRAVFHRADAAGLHHSHAWVELDEALDELLAVERLAKDLEPLPALALQMKAVLAQIDAHQRHRVQ